MSVYVWRRDARQSLVRHVCQRHLDPGLGCDLRYARAHEPGTEDGEPLYVCCGAGVRHGREETRVW